MSTTDLSRRLVEAIRAAARARIAKPIVEPVERENVPGYKIQLKTTHKVIAIGASTGGTIAIEKILSQMPLNIPGIVVVQHMPEYFTASFAERLNTLCKIEVREARDGDTAAPGLALIAPGGHHMLLERSGAFYQVRIKDGPMVHHQKPSVDVLFHSVAKNAGANAMGILLTGMGADGADGLVELHRMGGLTLAQDPDSSVVFGMPRAAAERGAAELLLPPARIGALLAEHLRGRVP